jgi:hypothetical protein
VVLGLFGLNDLIQAAPARVSWLRHFAAPTDKTTNVEPGSRSLRIRRALKRVFDWRRLLAALIAATLITVAVTTVQNILRTPHQPIGSTPALPGVSQQTLGATDLQTMTAAFGPFVQLPASSSDRPDTKYPALLLMHQDSSEAASVGWTVPVTTTQPWEQLAAPQLSALSVAGDYASFKLATSTVFIYTVRVGQPFVLESEPQRVMYIDATGHQWSMSFGTAKQLRLRLH